jgi:hypothetical protein
MATLANLPKANSDHFLAQPSIQKMGLSVFDETAIELRPQ